MSDNHELASRIDEIIFRQVSTHVIIIHNKKS